jgi:uncharacterized protein
MIARAMSTQPQAGIVSPLQLAKKNARWRGQIAISDFERLGGMLRQTSLVEEGLVDVCLEFSAIDRTSCRVTGRVDAEVEIDCQSCLEAVRVVIAAQVDFTTAQTAEQAQEIAATAEPYVLEGETVSVAQLIEDDLLLSLPTRGCEVFDECPRRPTLTYPVDGAELEIEIGPEKQNPFAVLAQLKQRED